MSRKTKKDPLADALNDWRAGHAGAGERLSASSRLEILRSARRARTEAPLTPLASLFVPRARWAYAAAIPLLLLAVTVGWIGTQAPSGPISVPGPDVILVEGSKIDGEAVFRIANGGRTHAVYRSDSPQRDAVRELLETTDGAFRDRLEGTTAVVYYRID